jgi:hypothetical protein
LAVSRKLPPAARYRSRIATDVSSSAPQLPSPKVIVPRVRGLIRRPDRPSVRNESNFVSSDTAGRLSDLDRT